MVSIKLHYLLLLVGLLFIPLWGYLVRSTRELYPDAFMQVVGQFPSLQIFLGAITLTLFLCLLAGGAWTGYVWAVWLFHHVSLTI